MQKQENQAKEINKDYFSKLLSSKAKFEIINEGRELSNFVFLQLKSFPGVAKISVMLRGTHSINGAQNRNIDLFYKQFRQIPASVNIPDYENIKGANWSIYPLKSNFRLYGFVLLRFKSDDVFNLYQSFWSDYLFSLTQFLENVWLKQKLDIEEKKKQNTDLITKSELSKKAANLAVNTAEMENVDHFDLFDSKQTIKKAVFKEVFQSFSGAAVLLVPVLDSKNVLVDFKIISASPGFIDIFGEIADSAKMLSHYLREDYSKIIKMAMNSLKRKKAISIEEEISTHGKQLKIEFLAQKNRKTVLAIIRDITDENTKINNFEHMMSMHNKLLLHLPAGILFLRKKVVTMANPMAIRILGRKSEEDFIGQYISDIFPETKEINELFKDDRHLKDKTYSIKEIEFSRPNSSKRILNFLIAPEDKENLCNAFVMFQDITRNARLLKKVKTHSKQLEKRVHLRTIEVETEAEKLKKSQKAMTFLLEDVNEGRKMMENLNKKLTQEIKGRQSHEEELSRITLQLKQSNSDLEAFSYLVSHDLRAPLRHLSGFIGLLSKHSRDLLDTKSAKYMEQIETSAVRMGVLIDSLLDLSRKSRQALRKTEFPVKRVVDEIIRDFSLNPDGSKISFVIEDLPIVKADKILFRQVLENLFSNAVKFTRNNSERKIIFALSEENNQEWIFYVKDNGAGFNEKYIEKLFGVFQRLHRQDEFEGTGIGLAIVKKIINRHGGNIWARSSLGKGATFYFSLPKG